jgi:hypothetical protein
MTGPPYTSAELGRAGKVTVSPVLSMTSTSFNVKRNPKKRPAQLAKGHGPITRVGVANTVGAHE